MSVRFFVLADHLLQHALLLQLPHADVLRHLLQHGLPIEGARAGGHGGLQPPAIDLQTGAHVERPSHVRAVLHQLADLRLGQLALGHQVLHRGVALVDRQALQALVRLLLRETQHDAHPVHLPHPLLVGVGGVSEDLLHILGEGALGHVGLNPCHLLGCETDQVCEDLQLRKVLGSR